MKRCAGNERFSSMLEEIVKELRNSDYQELVLHGCRTTMYIGMQHRTHAPSRFTSLSKLQDEIQDFALANGRRLDTLYPTNGGVISEAQIRWHAVIPPVSVEPIFSARKHSFRSLRCNNFAGFGAVKSELQAFVNSEVPLIVSGPTGSGKTSFLVALMKEYCHSNRTIIIEELPEICLFEKNWIHLQAGVENNEGKGRFTVNMLVKEALRLLPDRIVLSEVRSEEIVAFLNLINTGHLGAMTTIHAGSIPEAKRRLLTISRQSGAKIGDEEVVIIQMQRTGKIVEIQKTKMI